MSKDLRRSLIRLAHDHPEFRDQLLPVLKAASGLTPAQVSQVKASAVSALSEASRLLVKVQSYLDRAWNSADAVGGELGTQAMAVRQAGNHLRDSIVELDVSLRSGGGRSAGKNPADVIEDKRRAENAKRSGDMSREIQTALESKGWVFRHRHVDGNILAYDHEETMNFRHKDLGTLGVHLYVNDDGN